MQVYIHVQFLLPAVLATRSSASLGADFRLMQRSHLFLQHFCMFVFVPTRAGYYVPVNPTTRTADELWKEEEEKSREIFKKFQDLAKSKGVMDVHSMINIRFLVSSCLFVFSLKAVLILP